MKKVLFTSSDLEKEITPEYQAMLDKIVVPDDYESGQTVTDEDTLNYSKEGN